MGIDLELEVSGALAAPQHNVWLLAAAAEIISIRSSPRKRGPRAKHAGFPLEPALAQVGAGMNGKIYLTTPEMQHGLCRGGFSLSLRKQRAVGPI